MASLMRRSYSKFDGLLYKNVRKEIPIKDDKWDELYKWQLITQCQDLDLVSIADKVRVTNLRLYCTCQPDAGFCYQESSL